jgi:hypothetical protein
MVKEQVENDQKNRGFLEWINFYVVGIPVLEKTSSWGVQERHRLDARESSV